MCVSIESAPLEVLEQVRSAYEREAVIERRFNGKETYFADKLAEIDRQIALRYEEQVEIQAALAADRARQQRLEASRAAQRTVPVVAPKREFAVA